MQTTRIASSVETRATKTFALAIADATGKFTRQMKALAALIKARKNSGQRVADENIVRLRSMQSERIKLRLLIHERKLQEVVRIVTQTKQDESAELAVTELCGTDIDATTKLSVLTSLATSNSRAVMPAMVALFNGGHAKQAQQLFFERLQNGDLARLAHNGEAKIFTIMEILGGIDTSAGQDLSSEYFPELVRRIRHAPKRQLELMTEILGDPKPDGFRYSYEKNNIAQPVKIAAINFLQTAPAAVRERALTYAAKDQDDHVAYNAIIHLNHLWRSQEEMIPAGLEPFALLNIDVLLQLCQLSAEFTWPSAAHADPLLEQFNRCATQLEKAQETNDAAAQAQLTEDALRLEDQLKRITERRVNCLQPLLNRITATLGVPNAQLEASDDADLCAAYLVGTGCVKVNRGVLLEDKPLSEELMSSLLHEIGHLEQDVLVIRMVADDLNLRFGAHSQLLSSLYERYSAGIGYAPSSMFLLAVLRLRDDKPLSPEQRRRAVRLFEAAAATNETHEQVGALSRRMERISDSYEKLESGDLDSKLLLCLRHQTSLAALFKKGAIPAVLLYELRRCGQELEKIVSEGQAKPPSSKAAIAQALRLYHSQERAPLLPLVNRLRTLLMQVLNEEYRELDRQRSALRRSGYHEEEAYAISDRVEIIVKALRKGW